jgi:hypothetical protein
MTKIEHEKLPSFVAFSPCATESKGGCQEIFPQPSIGGMVTFWRSKRREREREGERDNREDDVEREDIAEAK